MSVPSPKTHLYSHMNLIISGGKLSMRLPRIQLLNKCTTMCHFPGILSSIHSSSSSYYYVRCTVLIRDYFHILRNFIFCMDLWKMK